MNPEIEDRDPELRAMLKEWRPPDFPAALEERILNPRRSWLHFLTRGYIRVPVPVAACLAVLVMLGAWRFTLETVASKACAVQTARTDPAQPSVVPANACKNTEAGC